MTLNKIYIHRKDLSYSEVKESDSDIVFIRKDALLEWVKLAYGKLSMNPFDVQDVFEELIDKIK